MEKNMHEFKHYLIIYFQVTELSFTFKFTLFLTKSENSQKSL